MSSTTNQLPLKKSALPAAADPNWHAVALAEPSAAFVSFQRKSGNVPPTQNVNSAVSAELTAGQFGGEYANYAKYAVNIAHSVATTEHPARPHTKPFTLGRNFRLSLDTGSVPS